MQNDSEINSSSVGKCPMSDVVKQSDIIRQGCHDVFGPPTIKNNNKLGGLDGSTYVTFLQDFVSRRLVNIDILKPEEMLYANPPKIGISSFISGIAFEAIGTKKISRLGQHLYKNYVKYAIDQIESDDTMELHTKQIHLLGFAITFAQAFDCIFLTASQHKNSMVEWQEVKDDLWKIVVNLTRIPSGVQEGLTSSHDAIAYQFGEDKPYLLEHIGEALAAQKMNPEMSFEQVNMLIDAKNGYGICPAAVDGTLRPAFDLLFEIYGKILIQQKDNS